MKVEEEEEEKSKKRMKRMRRKRRGIWRKRIMGKKKKTREKRKRRTRKKKKQRRKGNRTLEPLATTSEVILWNHTCLEFLDITLENIILGIISVWPRCHSGWEIRNRKDSQNISEHSPDTNALDFISDCTNWGIVVPCCGHERLVHNENLWQAV